MDSQKNYELLTFEGLFFLGRNCKSYKAFDQRLKIKATCTNCQRLMVGACNPYQQYLDMQKNGTTSVVVECEKNSPKAFVQHNANKVTKMCNKYQAVFDRIMKKCSNCRCALYGECIPLKQFAKLRSKLLPHKKNRKKKNKIGTITLPVMNGRVHFWTGR